MVNCERSRKRQKTEMPHEVAFRGRKERVILRNKAGATVFDSRASRACLHVLSITLLLVVSRRGEKFNPSVITFGLVSAFNQKIILPIVNSP
jgi:hypothetical protein